MLYQLNIDMYYIAKILRHSKMHVCLNCLIHIMLRKTASFSDLENQRKSIYCFNLSPNLLPSYAEDNHYDNRNCSPISCSEYYLTSLTPFHCRYFLCYRYLNALHTIYVFTTTLDLSSLSLSSSCNIDLPFHLIFTVSAHPL